jgi:hypothetical protein
MRTDRGETLADLVLRETYRGAKSKIAQITTRPMPDLRASLQGARKFVLDEQMSAFLADLSLTPFKADPVRRAGLLDSLRHGAVLPFQKTWFEFDGQAFKRRLLAIGANFVSGLDGDMPPDPEGYDVPRSWGWLMEEHDRLPHAITMREFVRMTDDQGDDILTLPFRMVWNVKDEPVPWPGSDPRAGMIGHGIMGYVCEQIGIILDRPLEPRFTKMCQINQIAPFPAHFMVVEMGGVVRYAMSLLATLNDIPAMKVEVKPQRGYYARGQHRKFVEHTVIRLTVPKRTDLTMLAKRVIVAARRKGHEVRQHWRMYVRGAGDALCAHSRHLWDAPDDSGKHEHCRNCPARRTLIPKHERGDSTLGFVTHDYSVGRGDNPKESIDA